MKKICIAMDYKPSAENVARAGFDLAKAMDGEITLVHVVADAAYYAIDYAPFMGIEAPFMDTYSELSADLHKGAKNYLQTSARHLGGKNIASAVLEGDTATAILEFARNNGMDLLVIGSHSHSGLENMILGNTAVKLVKNATIPILVVPVRG